MGEIPDWYLLVRAARYLGVAPWDLASQRGVLAESGDGESKAPRTVRRGGTSQTPEAQDR